MRVGLIGYRFMGRAHSNAWRQAPRFFPLKADVEMHTICGRDTTGVQAARAQLGWEHSSTDWREVVASPFIDIVDIVTPTHTHAEIAIAAAENGKHVLCEKPLALDVKQARAMFKAAEKSKVVHMVCHNYRRIPAIALAKKIIAEGSLGRIFHYRARYANDPKDHQGFRDILVTERDGVQPYVSNWWPPGHIIGYEHTFVHAVADFVNACVEGQSVHPTFDDGLKNQQVLEAVEVSAKAGRWAKV